MDIQFISLGTKHTYQKFLERTNGSPAYAVTDIADYKSGKHHLSRMT